MLNSRYRNELPPGLAFDDEQLARFREYDTLFIEQLERFDGRWFRIAVNDSIYFKEYFLNNPSLTSDFVRHLSCLLEREAHVKQFSSEIISDALKLVTMVSDVISPAIFVNNRDMPPNLVQVV